MYKIENITNKILQGYALDELKKFPDECIDKCVTSPPYWCYSDDTEALTIEGWKLIKDIKIGNKVLALNPHNKNIYYEDVTNTIIQKYEGEIVEFKSRDVDLLVTPNHNMYVEGKDGLLIRERKPFVKKEN